MTCPSILLVGSGQLGSRYLQGLVKVNITLVIHVVDNNPAAVELAKMRIAEIDFIAPHVISFFSSFEHLNSEYDLGIIATPAHCRAEVISSLASSSCIKYWIIEKVLAQSIHQLEQINSCFSDTSSAWVNTSRRAMSWHRELRSNFTPDNTGPLSVHVSGGDWGLACNSIHFIDLMCWWRTVDVSQFNVDGLLDWFESKRLGFYDVMGLADFTFSDGSLLTLQSSNDSSSLSIRVETTNGSWFIDEAKGCAVGPSDLSFPGQIQYQSTLTPLIVENLFLTGHIDLAPLSESLCQHHVLLSALLKHWNYYHGTSSDTLPIT